MQSEVEILIKS